jgi:hypothetical protein
MFAVQCPQVKGGRGQRLVTERSIRSMAAVPQGWLLTVACPCGEEHALAVPRSPRLR